MKKLKFQYKMRLELKDGAVDHYFRFQCLPLRDDIQKEESVSCEISPAGPVREVQDGFGNRSCVGELLDLHHYLEVSCQGRVQVDFSAGEKKAAHPIFSAHSAYTWPEENLKELHSQLINQYVQGGGEPDALDLFMAVFLMKALKNHISYVPGVTGTHTTASQALALGQGVCQDYTHILICLCRLSGFPARYVAGAMVGEGATHAWTEVWIRGRWIGLDPANDRLADETYIRFSAGRDFGDCTVDKGCFKGNTSQQQKIYVKVEEEK